MRVLVLCTGNSARSQMAEALLNALGAGRVVADSAGSAPSARVNPLAIATLAEHGIAWTGHAPQGIDAVQDKPWDLVITVCDHAKESCPVFPGARMEHWGYPDPHSAGDFRDVFAALRARIEQWLTTHP